MSPLKRIGDFSLMDRRVVDVLKRMPERNRFVRGLRTWVGLRQTGLEYARAARHAGSSKYTFTKLVRLAFDGLVSYSFVPLRFVSNLGLLVSLSALVYMGYLLLARLLDNQVIEGWTSTVVIVPPSGRSRTCLSGAKRQAGFIAVFLAPSRRLRMLSSLPLV